MEFNEQQLEQAQKLEDMGREEAISRAMSEVDSHKQRIIDARDSGITNTCLYCGDALEGYSGNFCKPYEYEPGKYISCAEDHKLEREQRAKGH